MSATRSALPKSQRDRHQPGPFPLRLPPEVRAAAEAMAKAEERSLNWTLSNLIKQALGLKEPSP
ncbi:toxin-antitoxin system HicB family antitoxin [Stenotrophomonas maltophilia]|uniref:toxin-antitoxin system HicB family antitoxin n=1 Tax=Stenotrophomonas maltophilia TaxID=40324 RepID=UPI003C2D177A